MTVLRPALQAGRLSHQLGYLARQHFWTVALLGTLPLLLTYVLESQLPHPDKPGAILPFVASGLSARPSYRQRPACSWSSCATACVRRTFNARARRALPAGHRLLDDRPAAHYWPYVTFSPEPGRYADGKGIMAGMDDLIVATGPPGAGVPAFCAIQDYPVHLPRLRR